MLEVVRVVDSHTAGEPTRVVVEGGPDLGSGPLAERLRRFREERDDFRSAVVNEPRGSEVLVGALLVPPIDAESAAGVLFFNNVGPLGMCGHGLIGVVTTLAHLGRIEAGSHRIETPVGTVEATLQADGRVSFRNVASYRFRPGVRVKLDGATVTGDVAWGGNWFFLAQDHGRELSLDHAAELTAFAWEIRRALARDEVTGAEGAEIDHVELFGSPGSPENDSRNFVLCPGGAYDRSPCGTGTSAKLACLAADGKLRPGEVWRQESLLGTVFEGSVEPTAGDQWLPTITGRAFITAEASLLFDPADPFRTGIR